MITAALCESFDKDALLKVRDIEPSGPLKPNEVRVGVKAAALNFFDTLIVRNKYQYKPDLPFSPGAECAGEIIGLGDAVSDWKVGDRVSCYTTYGACRTEVVVPASHLARTPDGVTDQVACGLPVTYGTAMHGLRDRAALKAGETLVVTGAAGGAGLAAVEIGKRLGAHVIALASSEAKRELCRAHGADETIDYTNVDIRDALRTVTDNRGVDVVYDCVGGDGAEPLVRSLAWEGRFAVIGFAAGSIPKLPLNLLLLKGASAVGVFWGAFIERNPARHVSNMDEVLSWCASGDLQPHIEEVYPLAQINTALGRIKDRSVKGKIVISMT